MADSGFTRRLAVASARRPWLTIVVWVGALAASALIYLLWGDVFTSSSKFLNHPDSRVAADLIQEHGGGGAAAQLGAAVEQLAGGIAAADDGAGELARGSGKVAMGAKSLQRGLDKLANGAGEVSAGAGRVSSGSGILSDSLLGAALGTTRLADGLDRMSGATDSLSAALVRLAPHRWASVIGGAKLSSGAAGLKEGAGDLAAGAGSTAGGVQAASEAAAQLQSGASSLSALVDAYVAAHPEAAADPTFQQIMALAGQVAAGSGSLATGLQSASQGAAAVAAGASELAAGAGGLASGARDLDSGLAKTARGARDVDRGMSELAAGGDRLAGGVGQAASGSRDLADGTAALAAGSSRVASGVKDAAGGAGKVAKGTSGLKTGAAGLSDGLASASKGAEQLDQAIAAAGSLSDRDIEVVVVHNAALTVDDEAFERTVTAIRDQIAVLPDRDVTSVTSAYDRGLDKAVRAALKSDDGHTTLLQVEISGPSDDAPDHLDGVYDVVERADGQAGFEVAVTGSGAFLRDAQHLAVEDLKRGEAIGIPVALIILVIVFGTLVAAGLPLVLSLFAMGIGLGLTVLVGNGFELSIFAVNVLAAFGLAVGIDYSLFIVSRFREERHAGLDKADAIAAAAATASKAVFFSGLTVVLALGGMLIVPLSIMLSVGVGAITTVVAAVAAALTLLPAMLMLLGDRIESLPVPGLAHRKGKPAGEGWWGRAARRIMRRPALGLALGVALLLALGAPLLSMDIGGTSPASFPDSLTSKQGLTMLQRDFSAGMSEPVTVVVDGEVADAAVQDGLQRLIDAVDEDGRFTLTGVKTSADGTLLVAQLVQKPEAYSDQAREAVLHLRHTMVPQAFQGSPASVYVGGSTANSIDAIDLTDMYLWVVVGAVLLLSFVLLLIAFRSLLVSVTAVAMNLLSVGAAFGVLTLVFQDGLGARLLGLTQVATIESWVPLFMFCLLFGLSMDYQVFLLSRIRESWDATHDSDEAVVFGVQSTAGIITGAALIMVAVFVGLGSGQLVVLQELGVGLAVAVLLDAFVVRVIVAPATIALIGPRYWWMPAWLEWLPRVTIEGPARSRPAGDAADAG